MTIQESRELKSISDLIDTYVRFKNYQTQGDRKYEYYHPSEFGKCLRLQQYRHYAWAKLVGFEPAELTSKQIRLFDKGHNMHVRWKEYFDDMGNVLMGRWQCMNPLCHVFDDQGKMDCSSGAIAAAYEKGMGRLHEGKDHQPIFKPKKCVCGNTRFEYVEAVVFSEELKLKGNADIIINCDNLNVKKFASDVLSTCDDRFLPKEGRKVVIDMKTASSSSWKNQIEKKGAYKDHIVQLSIYVNLLDCDYGIILYENKDNSQIEMFKVDRDPKIWEVIKFQAKEMVKERFQGELPPPKPADRDDSTCKSCDFRMVCHTSDVWQLSEEELLQGRQWFYKCLL